MLELLAGARSSAESRAIRSWTDALPLVACRNADFLHAADLVSEVRPAIAIDWPDCIIAATCKRLGLTVATLNERHFGAVKGLRVRRPY